jgi:hypothetical protein
MLGICTVFLFMGMEVTIMRMLENSFSLSRIHSLMFIYLVADVTAVAD